ncbi:MAG TPA: sulfite exporter TauE/SafE family protein [Solirubrobacteraceae bacterium]|nr:sulfite exporter TauE/SafE family protein [Solirubrobacteraceae bacterium]
MVLDAVLRKSEQVPSRSLKVGFVVGASVGVLGGLIGLGGAEFRLPLLIGVFGFMALQAIILNKAMSLIVVATALPARLLGVPLDDVVAEWDVIVNVLAGSLLGAWLGATWATRMASATLYRVIAALLVLIAVALASNHVGTIPSLELATEVQVAAGVAAGLVIGIIAALMGVAGGELLIPTIVLLYAVDLKLAGSLSLAVSLPTMLVAFARYSRDGSFVVLREHRRFVLTMAAGSVTGTIGGGLMLGVVPTGVLLPLLVALLLTSSVKVWRHDHGPLS